MMDVRIINPPMVVKQIVASYRAGYSPIIVICGKMRVGKTTKAFILANWLSWLLFGKAWNWRENTIVNVDQFTQKLQRGNEGEIMVMDEVQRQLSRKKWSRPESILFSDLATSQAYKHYIMILILPHAWALGSDHAVNVNYVLPCHSRTMIQPYRVESNMWDISLKLKIPYKFPLGHFHLDYKKKPISLAFADELQELESYKKFISVELKEKVIDEAMAKKKSITERIEEDNYNTYNKDDEWIEKMRKNPVKINMDELY